MAEPHAHSQPIQTYGPAPHNRNIWPHNSRATAAPSRLADSFVCFSTVSLITCDICCFSTLSCRFCTLVHNRSQVPFILIHFHYIVPPCISYENSLFFFPMSQLK